MNDNGGTVGTKVFNAGMRGQKVTPYSGGTRGMAFFRWPGMIKPGDRTAIAAHIDLFPTLAGLAGAETPKGVKLDGASLLPLLENSSAVWPDRWLFTHVGRWPLGEAERAKFAGCSIRHGDYHLISPARSGKLPLSTEPKWELYDLRNDPGERKDLATARVEIVQEMSAAYDRWWAEVLYCFENEDAYKTAPKENPFKELFRKQFPGD
jgi:arylsulfatase